jgi:hypothetical protein
MNLALAALALAAVPGGPGNPPARSSGWLARLPDGEAKRKFPARIARLVPTRVPSAEPGL